MGHAAATASKASSSANDAESGDAVNPLMNHVRFPACFNILTILLNTGHGVPIGTSIILVPKTIASLKISHLFHKVKRTVTGVQITPSNPPVITHPRGSPSKLQCPLSFIHEI